MKPFGTTLKEARLARNVSLDTIASHTHVARHYLDALERSDLEALPGRPFDKGYIRSYAQYLGIDPEPVLEAYAVEEQRRGRGTPESERQMMQELSRLLAQRPTRRRGYLLFASRDMRLALTLLALGLLVAGGWGLLRNAAVVERDPQSAPHSSSGSEPLVPSEAIAHASSAGHPEEKVVSDPHAETGFAAPDPPEETNTPHPGRLAVRAFGAGTDVVERRLVGKSDRFLEGTRVWFWTLVVGGRSGEVLRHVWLYEGRTVMNARLNVGGPHWRTYSRFTLPPGSMGSWVVEVRGAEGEVLARERFQCLPTPDSQTRS